jgi:hypothetical protein
MGHVAHMGGIRNTYKIFVLFGMLGSKLENNNKRILKKFGGAVGGMRIGKGNRSTQRKPAPVSLCPPQIPHDLTWDETWATVELLNIHKVNNVRKMEI